MRIFPIVNGTLNSTILTYTLVEKKSSLEINMKPAENCCITVKLLLTLTASLTEYVVYVLQIKTSYVQKYVYTQQVSAG